MHPSPSTVAVPGSRRAACWCRSGAVADRARPGGGVADGHCHQPESGRRVPGWWLACRSTAREPSSAAHRGALGRDAHAVPVNFRWAVRRCPLMPRHRDRRVACADAPRRVLRAARSAASPFARRGMQRMDARAGVKGFEIEPAHRAFLRSLRDRLPAPGAALAVVVSSLVTPEQPHAPPLVYGCETCRPARSKYMHEGPHLEAHRPCSGGARSP
jgi:hypothetical protein